VNHSDNDANGLLGSFIHCNKYRKLTKENIYEKKTFTIDFCLGAIVAAKGGASPNLWL